nr:SgcJ/EcaC family oxidoreductase [Methanosarcina horonobensis]
MGSQEFRTQASSPADESSIRALYQQLIDGWNQGSGEAFAAPFAENADLVGFDGAHLKGRQEIASFHQQLFDTYVKDIRMEVRSEVCVS